MNRHLNSTAYLIFFSLLLLFLRLSSHTHTIVIVQPITRRCDVDGIAVDDAVGAFDEEGAPGRSTDSAP